MNLFDSHCHIDQLHDPQRALHNTPNLKHLVAPAIHPKDWPTLQTHASPRVWVALGIHPHALETLDDSQLTTALQRLPQHTSIVAIGEIGLDKRTARSPRTSLDRQQTVFETQLEIARDLNLPPIIHCVRAHQATLESIRRVGLPTCGGVLHGYTGSSDMVPLYEREGLYFGFGGSITWPRAKRPTQSLQRAPLHRVLLETDAPWQTPHPFRSEPNTPVYLPHIAQHAAQALQISVETLAQCTFENAVRLFQPRTK